MTFSRRIQVKDLNEVKEQMGGFLFEYNHLRRHGGLNYMTPFDKLEKVTELVSENNAITLARKKIQER